MSAIDLLQKTTKSSLHTALLVMAGLSLMLLAFQARADTVEPSLQPNTMAARVAACTLCHGEQGRAGADGYYPRLAGKPQDYLYHQLLNFRDGRRQYRPMQHLLQDLPDDYLYKIAGYFADQRIPYPAAERPLASAAVLEQGRVLAMTGDATRGLPACIACHGATLAGVEPAIPGLLGLANDYLVSQLGAWQHGLRHAASPDCMADVASTLSPSDVQAVSAWLSAQAVIEPYVAEPAGSVTLPVECAPKRDAVSPAPSQQALDTDQQIQQGKYLATVGNCMGCHTTQNGKPYAGGAPITTSFGTFYGPNITPDAQQGIGLWSPDDFWQAMHNGKSADGSLLYPAFPYTEYTHITRADADALYAYLQSIEPVPQASQPHQLEFPYNMRPLMTIWRALYFRPGTQESYPDQSPQWTRGRYLVEGLGHCIACHAPRNRFGATNASEGFAGGMTPDQAWYASPLTNDPVTGLGKWSAQDIAALLKTGTSIHSTATGPMAQVVINSTQYLTQSDAMAIGTYLKTLPTTLLYDKASGSPPSAQQLEPGKKLYTQYCAQCHQDSGQGSGQDWATLVGNPTVVSPSAVNAIRLVLNGGYAPATQDNPQPHGMPPFGQVLDDADIARVLSYIRNSWGNEAGMVTSPQVRRVRQN